MGWWTVSSSQTNSAVERSLLEFYQPRLPILLFHGLLPPPRPILPILRSFSHPSESDWGEWFLRFDRQVFSVRQVFSPVRITFLVQVWFYAIYRKCLHIHPAVRAAPPHLCVIELLAK